MAILLRHQPMKSLSASELMQAARGKAEQQSQHVL